MKLSRNLYIEACIRDNGPEDINIIVPFQSNIYDEHFQNRTKETSLSGNQLTL